MSDSARYHAQMWAADKSWIQIADRIESLQNAPEWQGVEFDDVRARHMRQTEIVTLREILNTL